MYSVVVKNISKTYGKGKDKILAVSDIGFDVSSGEIFGLIGPDGSGKTSVFRILTTLLLADAGSATIENLDIAKDYKQIRKILGYMPGKFSLYQDLTVEENLQFFASIFNTTLEENYHLIEEIYVQLAPFKTRRAGQLSGGMKQKLALCCALIHQPKVLFLDEPTTGVDPVSRKEFWQMLHHLKEQGIAIVVATPYMDEAALCDRIALMQNGRILRADSPENICKTFPDLLLEVNAGRTADVLKALENFSPKKSIYAFGENVHLTLDKEQVFDHENLLAFLRTSGFKNATVTKISATVEDSFINLLAQK